MKIVVAGLSGYVGSGVLRHSLSNPAVTSIIALGRRPTPLPSNLAPDADPSKLKSVVVEDFLNYSEPVKKELAGADACIWLIGITPQGSRRMKWEQVRTICRDYTIAALETLAKLPRGDGAKPFRFIYLSGAEAERDPSKKPLLFGDFLLLRGGTESRILEIAGSSGGAVEVVVAKPGLVRESPTGITGWLGSMALAAVGMTYLKLEQLSAALVKQACHGIDKDTLLNEELVTIGEQALEEALGKAS